MEAVASDDEDKSHHRNTAANLTPRTHPGRLKTTKRETTGHRGSAKGGKSVLARLSLSASNAVSCSADAYFEPVEV